MHATKTEAESPRLHGINTKNAKKWVPVTHSSAEALVEPASKDIS